MAGRRADAGEHREVGRGLEERRPRHGLGGRAGDHPGRGQRPLLLVVPAGDVHRAAAPLAARDHGGPESLAEDPAPARAAEDPAVHHVGGGGASLRALRRGGARHHLGRRVPARGGEVPPGGGRVRPPRARRNTRRADHPALLAPGERGARAQRRRRFPAQGLAAAAPGAARRDARALRLRRLRLPPTRRGRGGPGLRPARSGGEARHGAGGVDRAPRGPQPLLPLAQGAHRVRAATPYRLEEEKWR